MEMQMRIFVYIDGLNLYHRALKNHPELKWLNLEKLCQKALGKKHDIIKINYYTALVSGKFNGQAPKRQQLYFKALATLPLVEIHKGKMEVRKKKLPFQRSPKSRDLLIPKPWLPLLPRPKMAKVFKTEEKGSDVALGVHLVRDAFQKKYDIAAIITNDTDLCEPIRIVTNELKLPVILISPNNKPAASLEILATSIRHIDRNRLLQSQFANPLEDRINGKNISKPEDWG
ncbi:MAG: NYN domain-containing protein [Alphaproteobacteria bacterium]|nr:NYN domain-containing protein [Alphaproteobacteria bacterium]